MKREMNSEMTTSARSHRFRKLTGLFLFLALLCLCAVALADVELNKTNFPDENFRKYVKLFDTNGNGSFSKAEIAAVTRIECMDISISDLQGVEHFTALEHLNCSYNRLTSLDVSKNTALEYLDCVYNQLTSLNVSRNAKLQGLYCDHNQLTSLDVSRSTALIYLYCQSNQLSKLDVRKNTALKMLQCNENQITRLDISKTRVLKDLVEETKPGTKEYYGYGWWHDNEYGVVDQGLFVDKSVKVITDGEEARIDISEAKVTAIKAQVYTGKTIKPKVTVKQDGKKLTGGKDYTVAYKDNKKIGTATVTITGKGDYTGKKTVTFDIIPKGVKLSSLTVGKKTLSIKWAKGSNITGYEIEYSLKKNFKDAKSVTIKKAATTNTILKKLQVKTVYYVRIRTYKIVSGKKYCSAWSPVKIKKTK